MSIHRRMRCPSDGSILVWIGTVPRHYKCPNPNCKKEYPPKKKENAYFVSQFA